MFETESSPPKRNKKHALAANVDGFSTEASVHFGARDRAGRERILKYCFRPPLAMERLSVLADGSVAYLTKYGRGARRHLVLSKIEFMSRLAALIPPPKIPMVRYSGVLAPNSSWRKWVVPKESKDTCLPPLQKRRKKEAKQDTDQPVQDAADKTPEPVKSKDETPRTSRSSSSYVSWAELLKRSFGLLVLVCPDCGSVMQLAAVITGAASVERILGHLQLPTSPIPVSGPYMLGFDEMGFEITGQDFEGARQWDGVDVPGPDG
jgi:hypothetical protein